MKNKNEEKVFLTRDSGQNFVFVWRKPEKGLFEPINISKNPEKFYWQRADRSLDNIYFYNFIDFQKKYGILVNEGEKISLSILEELLDNQDYKVISDDINRKK